MLDISDSVMIYNEFEIEPFTKFSLAFQAEYWYLKYRLLKDGIIKLNDEEFNALYNEKNINIIWLSLKVQNDLTIECRDGEWVLRFFKLSDSLKSLIQQFKLNPVPNWSGHDKA